MIPETHHLGTEVHCLESYSGIMKDNKESSFIVTNSSASTLLSILLSSVLDQFGMKGRPGAQSQVQPPTSCQRPTRGSNRSTVSLVVFIDFFMCKELYSSDVCCKLVNVCELRATVTFGDFC